MTTSAQWLALAERARQAKGLHDKMAAAHPALARGQVWCINCGATMRVNSAGALRHGWPKCCGYTMTIDSPQEREAKAAQAQEHDNGR